MKEYTIESTTDSKTRGEQVSKIIDILMKSLDLHQAKKKTLSESTGLKKYRAKLRVTGANIFVYADAVNLAMAKKLFAALYKGITIQSVDAV